MTAALVVVQLLTYVAALGFPSVITLEYFDRRGGLPAAHALVLVTLAFAAAIALVTDLLGPLWARNVFSGLEYDLVLRVAVWSAVPMALLLAVQGLLRAQDRASAFVVVTLVGTAGAQVLGVGAAVVWEPTASTYVAGVAVGLVLAGVVGLWLSGIDVSRVRDAPLIRSALKLGLPTVPHPSRSTWWPPATASWWSVSSGLRPSPATRSRTSSGHSVSPSPAPSTTRGAPSCTARATRTGGRCSPTRPQSSSAWRASSWASSPSVGRSCSVCWRRATIARSSSHRCRAVVAISVIPYIDYLANSHAIFYCRHAWSLAWMTPVAAAVNVAMNLLLLPHLGLIGAAYATVAGYLVQAVLARAVRSRFLQVPWRADAARSAWVLGVACRVRRGAAAGSGVVARAPRCPRRLAADGARRAGAPHARSHPLSTPGY